MVNKVLLVSSLLICSVVFGQNITTTELVGQWEYEYSLDSANGRWSSYLEKSSNYFSENNINIEDSVNSLSLRENLNYPLLLLDRAFTIRIISLSEKVLKVNFLEYTNDESSKFTYFDRTNGFVRAEFIFANNETVINFFNDTKNENYKIISFDRDSFTLLDESKNLKHIFKRKL